MSAVGTSTSADWLGRALNPEVVALLGVSDHSDRLAGRVQHFLDRWGFGGRVYPVDARRPTVQGRATVGSLAEIPEPIDVAFVMLAAADVPAAVRDCVAHGIRVVIVGSSGFAEMGDAGRALEDELRAAVAGSSTRVIGPNCNGIVAARSRFAASFMTGLDTDRFELGDGGVSIVSQSGAIGAFIFTIGQTSGLRPGTFIATGNEVDVGFEEAMLALVEDPGTRVILSYVEGLRAGPAFRRAARAAAEAGKPIVLLKAGRTSAGARAAVSHTGALAGSSRVYSDVLWQLGVCEVDSIEQLVAVGRICAAYGSDLGSRLTIITMSGGAGILATDRAVAGGLSVPAWSPTWVALVAEHLPAFAATANPIDSSILMTDEAALENTLRVADENPETDIIVTIMGNAERSETELSTRLLRLRDTLRKPVVAVWIGASGTAVSLLNAGGLPAFADPSDCIDALAVLHRSRPVEVEPDAPAAPTTTPAAFTPGALTPADAPAGDVGRGGRTLDEVDAATRLAGSDLHFATWRLAGTAVDAGQAADEVGYPVVAKLRAEGLAHKSDLGGVRVGLADRLSVEATAAQLLTLGARLGHPDCEVVVAEQLDIAYELIVGAVSDATFGSLLTVGVGGILAEVLDDVAILLPDFSDADLDRALSQLRLAGLLRGARGHPAVDRPALAAVLRSVALSAAEDPEIISIDINPLAVLRDGRLVAADALIELDPARARTGGASADATAEEQP